MSRLAPIATVLLAVGASLTAAVAADDLVPPGAKLELLYTRTAPIQGGLTEGVAAAPDGSMYFSEIPFGEDKGMIMRFDPRTKTTTVFAQDSHKSNGLMFDAKGFLIACEGSDGGGRGVARWDVKTGKREVIADRFEGKRFNACNDLCIDEKGRIYFTDPRYLGTEPRELKYHAVYRIDTDGTVVEVTHDVEKPNGIAISPDQKTLYVADHNNGTDRIDPTAPKPKLGAMKVYAFPLGSDGLVNGPRQHARRLRRRGRERRHDRRHRGSDLPRLPQAQPTRRPRDRPDRQGSGLHQDRRAAARRPRAGRATRATSTSASATTRTCSTSPWIRAFTGSG